MSKRKMEAEEGKSVSCKKQRLLDRTPLEQFWSKTVVKDLIQGQKLTTIPADSGMLAACAVLAKNKILSAPVWDAKDKRIVGMFDYRDVFSLLLDVLPTSPKERRALLSKPTTMRSLLEQHSSGGDLGLVVDYSRHNGFYSVEKNDSLHRAMDYFGQGLHRVVVLDKAGQLAGLLSQSSVLAHLTANIKDLEKSATACISHTLEELKLGTRQPLTVDDCSTVLAALELLRKHGKSSIALVSKANKKLTGNFSLSDLKFIFSADNLQLLTLPCSEFISRVRRSQDAEHNFQTSSPTFTTHPTETLAKVMAKLDATHTHRLWICDNDGRVVGVISLSDILYMFVPPRRRHRWMVGFRPAV